MSEAKQKRGPDLLEFLARNIPFLPHPAIHTVLAPIMAALTADVRTGSATRMIKSLFQKIRTGLHRNPSTQISTVLLYGHGLVEDNLTRLAKGQAAGEGSDAAVQEWMVHGKGTSASEVKKRPTAFPQDTHHIQPEPVLTGTGRWLNTRKQVKAQSKALSECLCEFGLSLVFDTIRYVRLGEVEEKQEDEKAGEEEQGEGEGAETLSKSNPLVRVAGKARAGFLSFADGVLPLAASTLETARSNESLRLALNLVSRLALLPIQSMGGGEEADPSAPEADTHEAKFARGDLPLLRRILKSVLRLIATHCGVAANLEARSDVGQAAIRCVTTLLRSRVKLRLGETHIKALLQLVEGDMEVPRRAATTFALLRVIMTKCKPVAELYLLMNKVSGAK